MREPDRSVGKVRDPFGGDFLEQLARTPKKTLDARLRRIASVLRVAVPQLEELVLERDQASGVPHLKGLYKHWRPNAGWQTEEHVSDGTLRLLGLLWVFLDGAAPLLLEEPELSLHTAVVRHIPLSRRHHRAVHEGGFEVRQRSDGATTFLRPNKAVLEQAPELPASFATRDESAWQPDDIPVWDGTPLHLAYAIDVLYARPDAVSTSMRSSSI